MFFFSLLDFNSDLDPFIKTFSRLPTQTQDLFVFPQFFLSTAVPQIIQPQRPRLLNLACTMFYLILPSVYYCLPKILKGSNQDLTFLDSSASKLSHHGLPGTRLQSKYVFFIFLRRQICLTLIIPLMNALKQNIRVKSITLSDCEGFFLFHDFKVIYLQHNKD